MAEASHEDPRFSARAADGGSQAVPMLATLPATPPHSEQPYSSITTSTTISTAGNSWRLYGRLPNAICLPMGNINKRSFLLGILAGIIFHLGFTVFMG